MGRTLSVLFCLCLGVGLQGPSWAGEDAGQTRAKLEDVRKQIKELQRQEQALRERLEEEAREAARREAPYVKVEVRGALRHEVFSSGANRSEAWTITAGDFKWEVDFGKGKDLLKRARDNDGKRVVVTGRLVTRPATFPAFQTGFGHTTVVEAATLEATGK